MMNWIDRRAGLLAFTWGVIMFLLPRTSSAGQGQQPRSIPDIEFQIGAPSATNNGSAYKVTGLDPKYLTGNTYTTAWLAEGDTGYVSVKAAASNRTFTLSIDGKLDTSNADKSKSGEDKGFLGSNFYILIPCVEDKPRVHLTLNVDLDLNVSAGLTTPKNKNSVTAIQCAGRIWFIHLITDDIFSSNGPKFAQAHRSFHHQFSVDVVGTIDFQKQDNKTTLHLLSRGAINGGPQRGLQCYSVTINDILGDLFTHDRSLQSDPPQPGDFSFLTDWIELSELKNGTDEWVKATATGKVTVTVDYAALSPIKKPLLPEPHIASGISLAKATTTDASSVTVDYTVSGKGPSKPIDFKFFRSSAPNVANDPSGGSLIGENVDTQPGDLASGKHTVTFLKGVDLPPDAKRPYVVVVATSGTDKSSTYFRKWRLATVAHGYAGYNTLLDPGAQSRTIAWVNTMADFLKGFHYCDDAIRYLWVSDSIAENPNMLRVNGKRLALQIQQYVSNKSTSHPGDVIDLLMVGHSRGTVVISQALQNLTSKDLTGSNVAIVLLDCHPASRLSNPPAHVTCDYSAEAASVKVIKGMSVIEYLTFFQNVVNDPEIVIPNGINIKSIDVWWQHTTVQCLKQYQPQPGSYLNLWGIGALDNRITNNSGISITWHDVTTTETPSTNSTFPVGHEEVHQLYKDSLTQQIH